MFWPGLSSAGESCPGQPLAHGGYSAWRRFSCNFTVSALPHPTERRLRGLPGVLRGQVLAVAPGTAGAVLVMPLAARDADHGLIVPATGV
jgi:hypothetical protein